MTPPKQPAFSGRPVTQAEYHARVAADMTERGLLQRVRALAAVLGWRSYHTHDSRRSEAGYPDLHLVSADQRRSLFRELKTQRGRVTRDQQQWLDELALVDHDVGVWRPADWLSGRIERELRGSPEPPAEAES